MFSNLPKFTFKSRPVKSRFHVLNHYPMGLFCTQMRSDEGGREGARAHLGKIAIYFYLLIKYIDFFLNDPLKGNSYLQGAGFQVILTSFLCFFFYITLINLSVLLSQYSFIQMVSS